MLVIGLIGSREVIAGALDVLLVFAAIELLGMGESGAGYLSAGVGLGAVVGGASTLALAGRPRIAPFLLLGALGWGAFVVLIPVIPSALTATALLVAAGVGLAVLQVTARTLLQRLMPVDALAGVFGVLEGFIFGGLAVGALVAGPLVAILGLRMSIVVLGLVMPIVTLAVLPTVMRAERNVEIPLREIAMLRRLRLFAPVPAPAVEAAARRLIPVTVGAGQAVVREGEPGDRFYVVVQGAAAVRQDGRELRTLGPGDAFGEIALLRRVPRTASVVAIEPLELRALERDDFLLAVTGTPEAIDEAARVADAYLERDAASARSSA
jgi:MFS family permease